MFKRLFFIHMFLLFMSSSFAQVETPPVKQPNTPVEQPTNSTTIEVEIPNPNPDLPNPDTELPNPENNEDTNEGEITEEELPDELVEPELEIPSEDEIPERGKNLKTYPPVGIYGHDYLRTSNFPYFTKATDVTVSDDYILGTGDRITVSAWAPTDFVNDSFVIQDDGFIQFSSSEDRVGFGRIFIGGLTLGRAKELLKREYQKYYRFKIQNFDVSLSATKTISVEIVGEVEEPGSYKITAINTAFNVLKLSGGPTALGSVRNIQIRRNGQVIETLDVYDYLTKPSGTKSIYLQDNDIIFIPKIGKVVAIEGAVKLPNRFELKSNESFNTLLEYAGGFKANAVKSTIQIYRYQNEEYVLRDFSFDPNSPNRFEGELYEGDLIRIKTIPAIAKNTVTTEGAFNQPGLYEYKDGMTLLDLIERAGGLRPDAVRSRAYITRLNSDLEPINIPISLKDALNDVTSAANMEIFPNDVVEVLSKADFVTDFNVDIFGQVKKPGRYKFGANLTLQDLLIRAGGFQTDAMTTEIELRRVVDYNEQEGRLVPVINVVDKFSVDYDFLSLENENNKLELRPYDQIYVRQMPEFELPKNITVQGEVTYPGKYPILRKDMRISDLIENAGGLTPFAYKKGAKFYRNDTLYVTDLVEISRRPSSEYNYVLKPGDRLFIPTEDETISIKGAINNLFSDENQINTAYRGRKTAKWYIDEYAAGYDDNAWKKTTQVIYPNGEISGTKKFLFFNIYPEVEPGSDIVVRYKPPKEEKTSKFFDGLTAEKTIALITSAATTTAIILAITKNN